MNLNHAVDDFLKAAQADGLSAATCKWYRSLLKAWADQSAAADLSALTTNDLRAYIITLRERQERYVDAPQKPLQHGRLSPATVAGHVTALHTFWAWAAREYDVPNPMRNVKRPRRQQPEPKAISAADFVRLFNATGDEIAGVRNRALLAFLADTGVRMGGLVGLSVADVDLKRRRAVVREKGNKTRPVVFTAITARFLLAWLSVRQSPSDKLFTAVVGAQDALTASGVEQILKRLKQKANVRGRVNPHAFRHAFAREYLRAGGDVVTLARLLGHSDVNTTAAYYAVFTQDELAELHEKYSPLKEMLR